jgi:zinc transport system permease protein
MISTILSTVPFLDQFASHFGWTGFELGGLIAVVLVGTTCGLVGTLVVGHRMAFFSDAMAHCAFAGVSLGVILTIVAGLPQDRDHLRQIVPILMVGFGSLIGLAIAFVREKTGLVADTVIGVFFAGAIGFGAMMQTALGKNKLFQTEDFLFGSPLFAQPIDLIYLSCLAVGTLLFLVFRFNPSVLASFHSSLARSRKINEKLNNILLILLLAFVVNLSIVAVGVLLINAMLIVPAATANLLARNLRQLFWIALSISFTTAVAGFFLSQNLELSLKGNPIQFGPSGTIICMNVLIFTLALVLPGRPRPKVEFADEQPPEEPICC